MLRVVLTCVIALSFAVRSGISQTSDVQQMRDKIQQLEQAVQDLKKQLAEMERGPALTPAEPAVATPPAPSGTEPAQQGAATPAGQQALTPAQEPAAVPIPQLPTGHVGRETRERNSAGQNQEGAPRVDNEPLSPELRGYFRVPGTGTLIKFGGFVKTDFFYDYLRRAGSYYGAYVPSSFPSSPQPSSKDSTVSMRPTRFSVEFRQPVEAAEGLPRDPNKEVKAYFEFDFLSNYDRNSIRLRQFYAQYRNVLAGQTWSAFGDPDAFPDTLEFEGPPGIVGLRSPQFRYTYPAAKRHSVGVSVEKSGTDVPFSTQFGVPTGTSLFPDFVAFYRYENELGHIHAATLWRSVGGFIQNPTVPNLTSHVVGYGASLSGAWGLGAKRDSVVFQFIIGKGISNYFNDNFGLGSDVGFSAAGRLVATPTGSGEIGYTHYWSKLVRTSFSGAYTRINNTAADPGTSYHISHYATANIIFQPTVRFLWGAEYIYGSLRRKDGFIWIAPRIQASITYYLNKYPSE